MYDLLIKGGLVIDGSGLPGYVADVAVAGDRVVAVGRLEGEAAEVIDANGKAVTPGFIDLHTHSDMSFLLDPTAQSKLRQRVTLELAGNCGFSFCAPLRGAARELFMTRVAQYDPDFTPAWEGFADYLEALEGKGMAVNLALQVGHNTLRAAVMGLEDRPPTAEELEAMKSLLAEGLEAGALGFSTGLYYAPGNYARLEEVMALAQVAADRGLLYSTHMRDEGNYNVGLFVALNETIEIGRRTGVRVEISHVKCMGPYVWGRAGQVLELIERARDEGIDVAGDQYPYTASSTSLTGALFPRWALDGGRSATLERMADPTTRDRLLREVQDNFSRRATGPEGVFIARFRPDPSLEGLSVQEVASRMGCGPAEAVLRLYQEGEAQVIVHGIHQADMEAIGRHPLISVGSDGSSLAAQGVLSVGKPHPRSYGTNPRYLAYFVRERRLVSLEEAVRKMTSLPAARLGLTRRGRIAPGFFADLVVLEPEEVADTATFQAPHSYPVGIPYVIVNGVVAVRDGRFTGATAGRLVRSFDG